MERLRIGLIGWGTVGSALGELVRAGPLPLTLESVAVRNRQRPDLPKGIEVGAPEAALEADIVVELAGGLEGPLTWARAGARPRQAVRDRQQGAPRRSRR